MPQLRTPTASQHVTRRLLGLKTSEASMVQCRFLDCLTTGWELACKHYCHNCSFIAEVNGRWKRSGGEQSVLPPNAERKLGIRKDCRQHDERRCEVSGPGREAGQAGHRDQAR